MIEKKMPSGAILKITLAPFKDAKALYQAVLEDVQGLKLNPKDDVDVNLFKDLFCIGMSSKKIELALVECMKRVLYNELKIDDRTFEPESAREDYFQVCIEVAKANIAPFVKNLMQQYSHILPMLQKDLA